MTKTDIFKSIKDDNGNFKKSLSKDVKGILSLFEASHLAFQGENLLHEAREFTRTHLNDLIRSGDLSKDVAEEIRHALELPLHQRMHLKDLTRWWKDMGSTNKLSFTRDRLMESFFWSVGMVFEPQYSRLRKELTKVASFITVIDDVYDVYGTVDELELFTDAVESKCMSKDITKQGLESLENYYNLLRWSSTIFLLANDLATSTAELERGETTNSISLIMSDTGLSEESARQHIRNLIAETWKKMNKDATSSESPFARPFVETAINLARIAQCTYQHGDGHGRPDTRSNKQSFVSHHRPY